MSSVFAELTTLVRARCVECRTVRTKQTYTIVGDDESGSFEHVCHDCQGATWWNVLEVIDESDPHAGGSS